MMSKGVRAEAVDQIRSDKRVSVSYRSRDSLATAQHSTLDSVKGPARAKGKGHFGCTGIRYFGHARWAFLFGMRRKYGICCMYGIVLYLRYVGGIGLVCERHRVCEVR